MTDVRSNLQNNAVVASYRDAPFGAMVAKEGNYDQPFKFQTKLWVGSCGLGYWGYRWYDPASGVWLSKDPLREAGGLNMYAYCGNDPVNSSDPLGLFWEDLDVYESLRDRASAGGMTGATYGGLISLVNFIGGESIEALAALSGGATGCGQTGVALGYGAAVVGMVALDAFSFGRGSFASKSSSDVLLNSTKQLQSKFKHAADFGVAGNANKVALSKFGSALNQHINSPGVKAIRGTYRGNPVTHYVDPSTGLNVMADSAGNFVSGWKLNPSQLQNVLTRGSL